MKRIKGLYQNLSNHLTEKINEMNPFGVEKYGADDKSYFPRVR